MGRRHKHRASAPAPASAPAAGPGRGRVLAAALVLVASVLLGWAAWRQPGQPSTGPSKPEAPAAAASAPQAYAALVGEWVRPDGGYVLAVSGVAADGSVTASYFNPRPIRVARAEAKLEGALVGLFVELRDVNYPGSTYTLAYDPKTDELKGVYYQAAQGAQYEVAFSRRR